MQQNTMGKGKAAFAGKLKTLYRNESVKALLPFLGLIVIVFIMNTLTEGSMLQPKKLKLLLSQVYYPMICATGVFFIMTLGSIDFSQGSILGLSSIVISWLSFYSIPLAILGGILTGAAIGAFNGFFHVRFKLPSFIVTICTMYLFRGLCAYFTTGAPTPASMQMKALDDDLIKVSVTCLVLLAAFIVFRFTKVGLSVKATGAGETAARFSGVRTDRLKFMTFVAAGALTGIAAFVNVIKVGSITSTAGNQLETQLLIALVLGGLPISGGAKVRFSNIIVGTLIYTFLNNGLVMMGYDTSTQQLIKGVIFLAVVALTIDRKALKVIK